MSHTHLYITFRTNHIMEKHYNSVSTTQYLAMTFSTLSDQAEPSDLVTLNKTTGLQIYGNWHIFHNLSSFSLFLHNMPSSLFGSHLTCRQRKQLPPPNIHTYLPTYLPQYMMSHSRTLLSELSVNRNVNLKLLKNKSEGKSKVVPTLN